MLRYFNGFIDGERMQRSLIRRQQELEVQNFSNALPREIDNATNSGGMEQGRKKEILKDFESDRFASPT